MKKLAFNILTLLILVCSASASNGQDIDTPLRFEFYGGSFGLTTPLGTRVNFEEPLSEQAIAGFYTAANSGRYQSLVDSLVSYREAHHLNDWIFYQLIRKTAQQISPKSDNYLRYTAYKWFLLAKSGYDATLAIADNKLFFYVRTDDDISDIPFFIRDGKRFMCLNNHDYEPIDLAKTKINPVRMIIPEGKKLFSYTITQLPDFKPGDYTAKDLNFSYGEKAYHFKVMLNPEVETIFTNYPVVDFASYFNIPLSRETYRSLIPQLRENIKGMSQTKGVDYLMKFTRNAFLYEDDDQNFGKEKRLSPEQTLFSAHSDCDDRVALFFYLVKEIYNLPMIALLYPTHITMAVQFNKPVGNSINYMGRKYAVCEPTPQLKDLKIGELPAKYQNLSYQVVYQYNPSKTN